MTWIKDKDLYVQSYVQEQNHYYHIETSRFNATQENNGLCSLWNWEWVYEECTFKCPPFMLINSGWMIMKV